MSTTKQLIVLSLVGVLSGAGCSLDRLSLADASVQDHYLALWHPARTETELWNEAGAFVLRGRAVEELEREIEAQRASGSGLELVQLDGYADHGFQAFTGAWQRRRRRTRFGTYRCIRDFTEELARLQARGYRLLDFSIYTQYQERRVAALWEEPPPLRLTDLLSPPSIRPPRAVPLQLVYDAPWAAILRHTERLKGAYDLVAIESYREDAVADEPLFAAVWEIAGTSGETKLELLSCHPDDEARDFPTWEEDGRSWKFCSLTRRVMELSRAGMRLVDLEAFGVDEDLRVLALFRSNRAGRSAEGWLQLFAHRDEVEARDSWFRGGAQRWPRSEPPFRGRLVKLVLLDRHLHREFEEEIRRAPRDDRGSADRGAESSDRTAPSGSATTLLDLLLAPPNNPTSDHLGLVHDSGTSGPPPGGE